MQERDVFSENAAGWWDPEGPFKMLHRMNPVRLAFIKRAVGQLSGRRILDYGCGGGLFSELLCQNGADVTGVDTSAPTIASAQSHALQNGLDIDYIHGTIDTLSERYFGKNAFDMVCAIECLEHVEQPKRLVSSLCSALKPGGFAVFSTLNRSWYTYMMGIIAAEYLLGWVEPGTHAHNQFIKPSELVKMARQSHLTLKDMAGMQFHLNDQRFHLDDDVSLNYIVCFQKPINISPVLECL